MLYFFVKSRCRASSSLPFRRSLGEAQAFGALVASLPLVSVLGMIWLWRDAQDPARMSAHIGATLWYVLPSLPMFALMPVLFRDSVGFWFASPQGVR